MNENNSPPLCVTMTPFPMSLGIGYLALAIFGPINTSNWPEWVTTLVWIGGIVAWIIGLMLINEFIKWIWRRKGRGRDPVSR